MSTIKPNILQVFLIGYITAFTPGCKPDESASQAIITINYTEQRKQMVAEQIKKRSIKDSAVIEAFLTVPRHNFVPDQYRKYAYADTPLPIGYGQTISQPYIVAYMTEILTLSKSDRVLEIGTGSGYQAAILAELCDSVFTIEINDELGSGAKELLHQMGYDNVKVKIADGYQGWQEHAPFDAIIVTCAPTDIPQPLKDQLKEGGKIIIPVGSSSYQYLVYLSKVNGRIREKKVLPVRFVPMVDSSGNRY